LNQDPDSYILTDADEVWLNNNIAPCVLLTYFPERTNPFWNMHMLTDGTAAKCDLILGGMECAGGAERSTNIQQQEYRFHRLPGYKQKLYNEFGQKRVLDELDFYFSLLTPLSIRSGCGIGLSRLAVALERYNKQTK
jgi:aspartyl/asparaginyl-tRNA synthetase